MDAIWIQMISGVLATMAVGIATNLVTPTARRAFSRLTRRMVRAARTPPSGTVTRLMRARRLYPVRKLARAVLR